MSKKFAKVGALVVGATFALSLSVNTAGAVTVAELQAQINALMAQLASLQGGSAVVSANFTTDLTIGSTGSQVVALQQMLVAQGHLVMPSGVAMGYFGTLTKAAVAKWQAANGLPATGYFGPMSRAKVNAMGGATGTVPGTTIGSGTTAGGTINTPGVEGVLTASLAPVPGAGESVEEGDNKVAVLGVELEAELSDIKIERVKVQLIDATNGNDRDFYRDIAEKLYVMDGSTVLASVDLDEDTVIEESSSNFYVTVTGLNHIIRKDTEDTLTIAIDAQDSWDSEFDDDSWTVSIPDEGIRGVDGAGINVYSDGVLSRTFNTDPASSDSATLTISLNSSTPSAAQIIATEGTDEDEIDGVELLKFNAKAEDDDVTITDVVVTLTRSSDDSANATATTAYLFDGSNQVASASVVGTSATAMTATFDDIEVDVSEGSTKVLSVRVDITDAASTAQTFVASVAASGITSENSEGDNVTESGSATGETMSILEAGPEITLVSKSITKDSIGFSGATSTARATFNIKLTAVGDDVYFGSQSASTTFVFATYKDGTETTLLVASSTSWSVPSSGVVTSGIVSGGFILQEGNSVTIPVDFLFEGRTAAGALITTGSYAIGLEGVKWNLGGATQIESDFFEGDIDWRTSSVTMP